jgi:hypothetical protein
MRRDGLHTPFFIIVAWMLPSKLLKMLPRTPMLHRVPVLAVRVAGQTSLEIYLKTGLPSRRVPNPGRISRLAGRPSRQGKTMPMLSVQLILPHGVCSISTRRAH